MNKAEAIDHVDSQLARVVEMARGPLRSRWAGKMDEVRMLANRCLKLKAALGDLPDGALPLDIEDSMVEIDLDFATRDGKRSGTVMVVVACVFLVLALITWVLRDTIGWGDWLAGNSDVYKYVFMGALGALVFFFTEGAFASPVQGQSGRQTTTRGSITRVALAVILPVVIVVVLLGVPSGASDPAASGASDPAQTGSPFNPDWIAGMCFGIGYSSKLTALLLEKIVEKGSKMIEAI